MAPHSTQLSMVGLKFVAEVVLTLFFIILVPLLVYLIVPKGAETISGITAKYVEYVRNLGRGCELGEKIEECKVCTHFGFIPNHTYCEESYGKNYYCNEDGKCKLSACIPKCGIGYHCDEEKKECVLNRNVCDISRDCYVYLIPPEDEDIEKAYAGYIHLYLRKEKDLKDYAIIPCYKVDRKYVCEIKKELLSQHCYDANIYWQTDFESSAEFFPEDSEKSFFCGVIDEKAENRFEIEIGKANLKMIKKFDCYKPSGSIVGGENLGTECTIELEGKVKGIVFLQGYSERNGSVAAPFFHSFDNQVEIDGDKVTIEFRGFERFVGKKLNFSFIITKNDGEVIFVSLPYYLTTAPLDCAKKDELCGYHYGVKWGSKQCCLDETTSKRYECVPEWYQVQSFCRVIK